jgi:hypothetical protein
MIKEERQYMNVFNRSRTIVSPFTGCHKAGAKMVFYHVSILPYVTQQAMSNQPTIAPYNCSITLLLLTLFSLPLLAPPIELPKT